LTGPLTIATVLKSGGDYGAAHVRVLHNALMQWCPGYDVGSMVCLTDTPRAVRDYAKPVSLKMNLSGWWSKMELFQRKLFPGPVIYLDLDTLIVGPLGGLVDLALKTPEIGPLMLQGKHPYNEQLNYPASGLMMWNQNQMSHVLDQFKKVGPRRVIRRQKKATHGAGQQGDQGFIRQVINPPKIQDYLPERYIRFKREYRKSTDVWPGCNVLCWSGQPRINAPGHPFINSYWRRFDV